MLIINNSYLTALQNISNQEDCLPQSLVMEQTSKNLNLQPQYTKEFRITPENKAPAIVTQFTSKLENTRDLIGELLTSLKSKISEITDFRGHLANINFPDFISKLGTMFTKQQ